MFGKPAVVLFCSLARLLTFVTCSPWNTQKELVRSQPTSRPRTVCWIAPGRTCTHATVHHLRIRSKFSNPCRDQEVRLLEIGKVSGPVREVWADVAQLGAAHSRFFYQLSPCNLVAPLLTSQLATVVLTMTEITHLDVLGPSRITRKDPE